MRYIGLFSICILTACSSATFDVAESTPDTLQGGDVDSSSEASSDSQTDSVVGMDSTMPGDSTPPSDTGMPSDTSPVMDTGSPVDAGKYAGVVCTSTVTCPGGISGNNCCYRPSAASFSMCSATCAPDEKSYACDGPEDCPSGTVCCANLEANSGGWIQSKSYCKPASLGCVTNMNPSTSPNTAIPCHDSLDCNSTFPKCCQFSPSPNERRSCVKSESDIPNFAFEGYKCYEPTF